eukprot:scaffold19687_cov127-Skeletonema_dohrnii-CCMP3373.AAC.1
MAVGGELIIDECLMNLGFDLIGDWCTILHRRGRGATYIIRCSKTHVGQVLELRWKNKEAEAVSAAPRHPAAIEEQIRGIATVRVHRSMQHAQATLHCQNNNQQRHAHNKIHKNH